MNLNALPLASDQPQHVRIKKCFSLDNLLHIDQITKILKRTHIFKKIEYNVVNYNTFTLVKHLHNNSEAVQAHKTQINIGTTFQYKTIKKMIQLVQG